MEENNNYNNENENLGKENPSDTENNSNANKNNYDEVEGDFAWSSSEEAKAFNSAVLLGVCLCICRQK